MKREVKLQKQAAELSAKMPSGTNVKFWPGTQRQAVQNGHIDSEFWVLAGHTVVVRVRETVYGETRRWTVASSHIEAA